MRDERISPRSFEAPEQCPEPEQDTESPNRRAVPRTPRARDWPRSNVDHDTTDGHHRLALTNREDREDENEEDSDDRSKRHHDLQEHQEHDGDECDEKSGVENVECLFSEILDRSEPFHMLVSVEVERRYDIHLLLTTLL